ncbi:hypothetical protein QJS66_05365 [Kocuria rhizophila]|nr:hypothetical protein QJS66_05365 [Kocuria rhizophila]
MVAFHRAGSGTDRADRGDGGIGHGPRRRPRRPPAPACRLTPPVLARATGAGPRSIR